MSKRPATIVRILRQTIESEPFRYIVERRHLSDAADEIERLEKENKRLEEELLQAGVRSRKDGW